MVRPEHVSPCRSFVWRASADRIKPVGSSTRPRIWHIGPDHRKIEEGAVQLSEDDLEEQRDELQVNNSRNRRNRIIAGITSIVLIIIGVAIVVWYFTPHPEPEYGIFEVQNGTEVSPFAFGAGLIAAYKTKQIINGCKGKLTLEPKLKRRDVEVDYDDEIGTTFTVVANKKKKKKVTDHIQASGNCCWEISDKNEKKDTFLIGEGRNTDKVKYIYKIKTIDC